MSSVTASPTWRCLSETLQQHRADCAAFAAELNGVLAGVEALHGQAVRQGQSLAREQAAIARERAEFESTRALAAECRLTLEARDAQYRAALAEIERLQSAQQLGNEATGLVAAQSPFLEQEIDRLQAELETSRAERDSLRRDAEGVRAENQRLTAAALDVVAARQELADCQLSLTQAHRELADAQRDLAIAKNETLGAKSAADAAQEEATNVRADLDALRAELAAVRRDLKTAQEEHGAARAEFDQRQAEWLEQLRSTPREATLGGPAWQEAQDQFQRFRDRLERSLEECAKWADAAIQATEMRQELAALRGELQARPAEVVAAPAAERNGEWERERGALETELELVRARAAELHESLVRQESGLSELRGELSGDIQQLRQLLESQAELLVSRAAEAPRKETVAPAPSSAAESDAPDSGGDPVLSSVMAQFARLQQDVAERRKKKKP